MANDPKTVIKTALKSMEKARRDMLEVVVFAPTKAISKEAQDLVYEVQRTEGKFAKLTKKITL